MDSKTYTMLKTVRGSRDGLAVETFVRGETYQLDADLAEQFYHQGAVDETPGTPADRRSTKVTGPAETKVTGASETKEGEAGVPLSTQHVEELVSLARDTYGLDVDSTMDEATLRQMIEQAAASETAANHDTVVDALVKHAEAAGRTLVKDEAGVVLNLAKANLLAKQRGLA